MCLFALSLLFRRRASIPEASANFPDYLVAESSVHARGPSALKRRRRPRAWAPRGRPFYGFVETFKI